MGIRRGSITTGIIADGLVFNVDLQLIGQVIPSTGTTIKTFNTLGTSNTGSIMVTDLDKYIPHRGVFNFDGIDDDIYSLL